MDITQKAHTAFFNGIPVQVPNEVRQNDPSFYVSYNKSTRDYGCPTTALVVNDPQMSKFYILCGDHREQYEAAKTLAACLSYYASQLDLQHKYSDDL